MGTGLNYSLLCVACFVLNMMRYCVIVCYKLHELYTWNNVHRKKTNTRVRKHNLRILKNKMNMIIQEVKVY